MPMLVREKTLRDEIEFWKRKVGRLETKLDEERQVTEMVERLLSVEMERSQPK